jgi:UDP-N-acetylmuramyl pentapeptide synthase
VEDNAGALQTLRKMIQPGDVLLIKGSRALRMEEIVAQLERR